MGTYGEDYCSHVVVEAGGADGFLVGFWRAGFVAENEASADPDGVGAEHQCCGERLAVEEPAGCDDLDGVAGHGGFLAFDHGCHCWDEDGCRHVAGVAASFAALGADEVDADVETFLHVLGVPDHVHVEDAGFVQTVDDVLGGDADGGDEELGAVVDDDADEVVEFAFGVVVAGEAG